jgi:hypothetical protein
MLRQLHVGEHGYNTVRQLYFNFCVVAKSVLCDEAISTPARGLLLAEKTPAFATTHSFFMVNNSKCDCLG